MRGGLRLPGLRLGDDEFAGETEASDQLFEEAEHVDVRRLRKQGHHGLKGLEQHRGVLSDGVVSHHLEVHLQPAELLTVEVHEEVVAGEAHHLRSFHEALGQVEHLGCHVFDGGVEMSLTGRQPGPHLRVDDGHFGRGLGACYLPSGGFGQGALEGGVAFQPLDELDDGVRHSGHGHRVEQRGEVAQLIGAVRVDGDERAEVGCHRFVECGAVDLSGVVQDLGDLEVDDSLPQGQQLIDVRLLVKDELDFGEAGAVHAAVVQREHAEREVVQLALEEHLVGPLVVVHDGVALTVVELVDKDALVEGVERRH